MEDFIVYSEAILIINLEIRIKSLRKNKLKINLLFNSFKTSFFAMFARVAVQTMLQNNKLKIKQKTFIQRLEITKVSNTLGFLALKVEAIFAKNENQEFFIL
jgi:hypothetical protein